MNVSVGAYVLGATLLNTMHVFIEIYSGSRALVAWNGGKWRDNQVETHTHARNKRG